MKAFKTSGPFYDAATCQTCREIAEIPDIGEQKVANRDAVAGKRHVISTDRRNFSRFTLQGTAGYASPEHGAAFHIAPAGAPC